MKIKWKEERREKRMQVRQSQGVTYLTYPAFEKEQDFIHGFTTRLGGVSQGVYASMNLSFSRGDQKEAVLENYRRVAKALGFQAEDIAVSDQTHTANVRVMKKEDQGKGIFYPKDYTDVDAMITNEPGVILAAFYADCVPLFFIDPVRKAVGLAHSGWRGTVGKIGKATVQAMERTYCSRPEDLLAGVGPSICQDCYEVSEDVIGEFRKQFAEKEHKKLFYQKENGRYQLNLWKANELILLEAGIRPEHIHMPGICTCCNPEFLFSHRASQGKRGNLAAFLGIKGKI